MERRSSRALTGFQQLAGLVQPPQFRTAHMSAATMTDDGPIMPDALIGALYVARSRDCGLTPQQSGARRFTNEVKALQQERDVNLPGLRLAMRSSQLLARGLVRPTALHLHGNASLGDAGATMLLGLLEHGTCRSLDFGACSLGPSFAPALARYMLRAPMSGRALEHVELGGPSATRLQKPNQIRGAAALAAVLQQRSPKLRSLGLSHNAIGSTAEAVSCVHALAALATHAPALACLNVAANGFGRSMAALLHLVPIYPALTELDVSGNELGDWGAEALAAALLAASAGGDDVVNHLRSLAGAPQTTASGVLHDPAARAALRRRKCALRSLAIADNRIHVAGARALSLAIASCASLRQLAVNDNPIGDDGAASIGVALVPGDGMALDGVGERVNAEAAAGTSPRPSHSAIESLNVSGCQIGENGARALGGVLATGRLVTLRAARNMFGEAGAEVRSFESPSRARWHPQLRPLNRPCPTPLSRHDHPHPRPRPRPLPRPLPRPRPHPRMCDPSFRHSPVPFSPRRRSCPSTFPAVD